MASSVRSLRDSLAEVRFAAHDQDLVEVPKRAMLDRKAEQRKDSQPLAFPEPVMVSEPK
ncbi:MAG TPA: hypothetical protein VGF01_07110 [Terracidiphilus sp.]|jgi:hypothetical protein